MRTRKLEILEGRREGTVTISIETYLKIEEMQVECERLRERVRELERPMREAEGAKRWKEMSERSVEGA